MHTQSYHADNFNVCKMWINEAQKSIIFLYVKHLDRYSLRLHLRLLNLSGMAHYHLASESFIAELNFPQNNINVLYTCVCRIGGITYLGKCAHESSQSNIRTYSMFTYWCLSQVSNINKFNIQFNVVKL